MDGGNRSPRPAPQIDLGKTHFNLYLPAELAYVIEMYKILTRSDTMTATIRHLLETHPELTRVAEGMYTDTTGS